MSHELSHGALVNGMVQELLEVVYKYHGAISVATAIGALEIVKQLILSDALGERLSKRKKCV